MFWDKVVRRRTATEPSHAVISASHPSSYAAEVELALICAVFSAVGGEGEEPGDAASVRVVVDRWHRHRGGKPADNLSHIAGLDDHAFCRVLADKTRLGGRPRTCVVQDAADQLLSAGIDHAADVAADPRTAKAQLASVRGLDAATIDRFCALLEVPSAKVA